MYEFIEPHQTGGDSVVRLTAAQAINYMLKSHSDDAKLLFLDDQAILDSFIAIYWAIPVDKEVEGVIDVLGETNKKLRADNMHLRQLLQRMKPYLHPHWRKEIQKALDSVTY
jgi:hypothetical protein